MRKILISTLMGTLMLAATADAGSLIANRAIPSKSIITQYDVSLSNAEIPGAFHTVEDALGLEARVTIYAGRPVRLGDLGPPAILERNDIVRLQFNAGGLVIEAEGRAMERAGVGDVIRVMNLTSRTTISGLVNEFGIVEVGR